MKTVSTLFAAGAFFAAGTVAQSATASAAATGTITGTALGATDLGVVDGAETDIVEGTVINDMEASTPTMTLGLEQNGVVADPILSTGITYTIDGALYAPATMCTDYTDYTADTVDTAVEPVTHIMDGALYVPATACTDYTDYTAAPTTDGCSSTNTGYEPTGATETGATETGATETGATGYEPTGATETGATDAEPTGYEPTGATGTGVEPTGYEPTGATETGAEPAPTGVADGEAVIKLIRADGETRQQNVPTNNEVMRISGGRGFRASEMEVVSAAEGVGCTAYGDRMGKKQRGNVVTAGEPGDVTNDQGEQTKIRAIRCSSSTGASTYEEDEDEYEA